MAHDLFSKQDKIDDYIRRQAIAEEYFNAAFELDPFTRVVYRRLRELYWTISRILKKCRAADRPQLIFPVYSGPEQGDRRIFIDVTDFIASGKATGIQRVVKELATHAAALGLAYPAAIRQGTLLAASGESFEKIAPREGDILFLPDAGWNRLDDYPSILDDFRAKGGMIVGCLHDLFPLIYPALYTQGLVANFQAWTNRVLFNCDAIVAVSKSSAENFEKYVKFAGRAPRDGMMLGWWRPGADFEPPEKAPARAVASLARRAPYFLSVGTIEMRKGYPIALDAFDRLWTEGSDANFIIVGRLGWNAAALEARLREHPQKGRRLFWLENAGDADLRLLYREARAVILPSIAEGFGLPLAEAAHFGAPVIASDIDVFHEMGGEGVRYFDVAQPESLLACLRDVLAGGQIAAKASHITWRDSTIELMKMLREGSYQKSIG